MCQLFVVVFFLPDSTYGQTETYSLGLRIGSLKNSHYDESFSYKVYNGVVINPFQLRFVSNTEKNSYIANLLYVTNSMSCVNSDNFIIKDNIYYSSGAVDFTYLRKVFNGTDNLNIKAGPKLSANGYISNREFEKSFRPMSGKQSNYDITFFSLNASFKIQYAFAEKSWINYNFDFPFLAVSSKRYNSKITPVKQNAGLVFMGKYSGFTSDLSFIQEFNRFSLEIFQSIGFMKYSEPYLKKILTNKIGIGLYYEF
jgi:hypothetical protein